MTRILIIVFLITAKQICLAQTDPANAKQLIDKMYGTYNKTWFKTLTFRQQTIFFQGGTQSKEETWYEAMDLEKGLVIKFNTMKSGDGVIFRNDSMLVYKNDQLANKTRRVHELLVLGFTVYTDSPEKTLSKLKESGFNLEHFTKETYNSTLQYVVGDPNEAQFWIDSKTLLFTKMKKKGRDGKFSEIEFKGYQKLDESWIETEVTFSKEGQLTMRELYHDIKAPSKLPESYYSQSVFSKITW